MHPPIILVMGPTGSGKTTFINQFLPAGQKLPVGGGLASVTRKITSLIVTIDASNGTKSNVELIDTPGLNDTNIADSTSLKDICEYLAERKKRGSNICGIIYCRSILAMRFTNTDITHQKLLHLLVGDNNFIHVAFLTTFWPPVTDTTYPICEKRERELLIGFWTEVQTLSCLYFKIDINITNATMVVNNLLDLGTFIPLVVDQIINLNLTFELTGIGKEIWKEFESIKEEIRESKKVLEKLTEQISTHDKETQKSFERQREEFERSIEKLEERQRELSRIDRERFSELVRVIERPIVLPPLPPPPAQNQNCSNLITVILQQQMQQQQQEREAAIRRECARKRRRDKRRYDRDIDDIYDEMDDMWEDQEEEIEDLREEQRERDRMRREECQPVYNPAPTPQPSPPIPQQQPRPLWPCPPPPRPNPRPPWPC